MRYILASASPRIKEILQNLGLCFEVITSDADESCDITDPAALTRELSKRKGEAVRDALVSGGALGDDVVIIASDTVV